MNVVLSSGSLQVSKTAENKERILCLPCANMAHARLIMCNTSTNLQLEKGKELLKKWLLILYN